MGLRLAIEQMSPVGWIVLGCIAVGIGIRLIRVFRRDRRLTECDLATREKYLIERERATRLSLYVNAGILAALAAAATIILAARWTSEPTGLLLLFPLVVILWLIPTGFFVWARRYRHPLRDYLPTLDPNARPKEPKPRNHAWMKWRGPIAAGVLILGLLASMIVPSILDEIGYRRWLDGRGTFTQAHLERFFKSPKDFNALRSRTEAELKHIFPMLVEGRVFGPSTYRGRFMQDYVHARHGVLPSPPPASNASRYDFYWFTPKDDFGHCLILKNGHAIELALVKG